MGPDSPVTGGQRGFLGADPLTLRRFYSFKKTHF